MQLNLYKAAVVIGRRKVQNLGLLRFLLLISVLCIVVTFMLLVPCHNNMITDFINNGTSTFDNASLLEYVTFQENNNLLTDIQMEGIEIEMRRRQLTVMDECHDSGRFKVKNILKTPKLLKVVKRFFIDKEHKLAWCPVFKAGSTTWMEIFATMGGQMTPQNRWRIKKGLVQMNQLARLAYPRITDMQTTVESLPDYTRFIIVRHPFERILSAYRDKLEHRKGREFYYRRYSRLIVRSQRPDNSSLQQAEPTFVEFLQYLVKTRTFDEHWRPFTAECAPCEFDYQLILKMESLEAEELYLATKYNLLQYLPIINSTKLSVHNKNPRGRTEYKYSQQYYSKVPRQLLHDVFMLYEEDFRYFHYSPSNYFALTKPDKSKLFIKTVAEELGKP